MSSKLKIWVVEDDETIQKYLKILLERENYEVVISLNLSNAEETLDGGYVPDVLILDLNLPDGYGAEICKRIKLECRTWLLKISPVFWR